MSQIGTQRNAQFVLEAITSPFLFLGFIVVPSWLLLAKPCPLRLTICRNRPSPQSLFVCFWIS